MQRDHRRLQSFHAEEHLRALELARPRPRNPHRVSRAADPVGRGGAPSDDGRVRRPAAGALACQSADRNVEACVREADRAIVELGAKGIQIFTNVLGRPLSAPEFRPIFRSMVKHDLPVWIHPIRGPQFSDYASEKASEHEIWFTFGWPYETTACVTRLIFSGIYDELPSLKIITHHMGGMVPFYAGKIDLGFDQIFHGKTTENPVARKAGLKRRPVEYYKMLYGDTALNGSVAATRCGHAFFTTGHCVFATDAPFDAEKGRMLIRETINAVNGLEIPKAEKDRIFAGNARALLKLDG
ncbi:MAG: amidohydrolase [Betaproteobacteria bacterium]|nr:MAG: amidohydrolase [Betaproteobacteria bacterium]